MVSQQALLQHLSDGQWHSGERLGAHFSVSRAAIWKQLQQLQSAGIAIESERGRGYRLVHAVELLEGSAMRAGLTADAEEKLTRLSLPFSVDSTNALAMEQIAEQSGGDGLSGTVFFAEQQHAGRGRRGRHWVSPLAQNIYCSAIWRFSTGASALSGLSLAVAVAVVEALEAQGFHGIELKWPNDLLWRGRKLAGILLEMSGDAAGPCHVVVGLGVNLSLSRAAPSEIDQPWVDLLEVGAGRAVQKNAIAAAILNQLLPLLADFERLGFRHYRQRWLDRDAFLTRDVMVHLGDERVLGKQIDIDDEGAICLQTASGRRCFNGGEVSLRTI